MSSPPPFYHCNCIAIVVITINFVIISSSLRKINGNRSSSLLSSSFSSLLLLLSWRSAATALSQLNQVLPQPGLHIARSDIAYCQVRSHRLPHQPPPHLCFLFQECGGAAWPLLQTVYTCRTCGHTVHGSCLVNIRRPCVGAFLNRLPGEDEDEGFPKTLCST